MWTILKVSKVWKFLRDMEKIYFMTDSERNPLGVFFNTKKNTLVVMIVYN